jgi:acetate kinase
MEMSTELFGADTPQVAVFDTAFHQTIPKSTYLYALPMELYEKHAIRKVCMSLAPTYPPLALT